MNAFILSCGENIKITSNLLLKQKQLQPKHTDFAAMKNVHRGVIRVGVENSMLFIENGSKVGCDKLSQCTSTFDTTHMLASLYMRVGNTHITTT